MKKSFFYVRAKVTLENGDSLPEETVVTVSVANLWMNSLFQYFEVSLNGKIVSAQQYYPYIAYLKAFLGNNGSSGEDMSTALYKEETDAGLLDANNPGFTFRGKYIQKSQSVEMCGELFSDIFDIDKYLLPEVELRLKFTRTSNAFNITSSNEGVNYKTVIENAVFYCRKHILTNEMRDMHKKMLLSKPAIYPFIKSDIKTYLIPKSAQNSVSESLFASSMLPHRILIALVKTSAMNGNYQLNPFNFEEFNVSNITVSVNSDASIYKNHNIEITDSNRLLAFQMLKQGLVSGFDLNRKKYVDGNNIYYFELAASQAIRAGNVKIEILFAKPLEIPVTAIIFSQNQSCFFIDNNYIVSLDS